MYMNRHGLWESILNLMTWLGRYELPILVMLALSMGGVWGFVELAEEVVEGKTENFDQMILLAMRSSEDKADPIGPLWVEELGRDFTALGGVVVLTIITIAVIGFMVLQGKFRAMLFLLLAIVGGLLVSTLLKQGFDRPRPDLVPYESHVYTTSFPSGHSMMSAVTYLTLGAMLARVQPRLRLKAYILILAISLTLTVGMSRVYMGVHWPTDVLAGWTAGSVWALLCWLVARWLQLHGKIEQDVKEPEVVE